MSFCLSIKFFIIIGKLIRRNNVVDWLAKRKLKRLVMVIAEVKTKEVTVHQ